MSREDSLKIDKKRAKQLKRRNDHRTKIGKFPEKNPGWRLPGRSNGSDASPCRHVRREAPCHCWRQPPTTYEEGLRQKYKGKWRPTHVILRNDEDVLSSYREKRILRNTVKLWFSFDWKLTN